MKTTIAMLFFISFSVAASQAQLKAVVCNSICFPKKSKKLMLREYPGIDLEKAYLIKFSYYWSSQETVIKALKKKGNQSIDEWRRQYPKYVPYTDNSFINNLKTADLLYIGQYNHESYRIFVHYHQDILDFLKSGGVVFFDFLGGVSPKLNKFLKAAGVLNPGYSHGESYVAEVVSEDNNFPLVTTPWKIKKVKAHGWWTSWSDKQIVPFQNPNLSDKSATVIIQEKVMGKGKIIFSRLPWAFRSAYNRGNKKLLENILSCIFDRNIITYKNKMWEEQGGPGIPVW
jgi:hypothetical protein